nr:pentapeptide repeat-containing protein [Helicobacter pullorum]
MEENKINEIERAKTIDKIAKQNIINKINESLNIYGITAKNAKVYHQAKQNKIILSSYDNTANAEIEEIDFKILQNKDITQIQFDSCIFTKQIFDNISGIQALDFINCSFEVEISIQFINIDIHCRQCKFKQGACFLGAKLVNNEAATFINTTFYKKADFVNTTFLKNVYFIDVVFKEEVNFQQANFESASFLHTTFEKQVSFLNATFGKAGSKKNINFSHNTFLDTATFTDAIFNNDVYFNNVCFYEQALFDRVKFNCKKATFSITCNKEAMFTKTNFNNAIFEKCNFQMDLNLGANFNSLNIKHSNILGNLNFNISEGDIISISNSTIEQITELACTTTNNIKLDNSTFKEKINISSRNFNKAERIDFTKNTFGECIIPKELFLKNVNFKECTFLNQLVLKDYEFNKTTFNTCVFKDNVYFNNSTFKDSADFHECEFEKTANFYGVKFDKVPNFSQAQFKGSLNVVNTNLDFDFESLKEKIKQESIKYKERKSVKKPLAHFANDFRDSFRIFKSTLIKDNNLLDASNFHKYELYSKEIELDSKETKTLRDKVDKLQLWLYRKLCDHHTDILKSFHSLMLVIGLFGLMSFGVIAGFDYCLGYKPILSHLYMVKEIYDAHIQSFIKTHTLYTFAFNIFILAFYLVILVCLISVKYLREVFIGVSYFIVISILLISPKILIPAMGIFTDKRALLDPLSTLGGIYTIVFGFVLFSFIKTIRKNSIVPS